MAAKLRNSPEIQRAHDLTSRKPILELDPVLYVHNDTARLMKLSAKDVVHPAYHHQYVFLENKAEILDLRRIQDEMKAKHQQEAGHRRPIVSVAPDGRTPTLLVADEETDAHEVQDLLGEQFEKNEARIRHNKPNITGQSAVIDTTWVRAVSPIPGPPPELFDKFFRQAIEDRMTKHKRNMISDPPRQPWDDAKKNGLLPDNAQIAVPDTYKVTDEKK